MKIIVASGGQWERTATTINADIYHRTDSLMRISFENIPAAHWWHWQHLHRMLGFYVIKP